MEELTRRTILRAALAAPALLETVRAEMQTHDDRVQPTRCEEVVGFEVGERDLPEPPDLSGGPPYFLQKSSAQDWPGYSGRVSEASAEKGRKLVKISEDGIVKLIENWLAHPEAAGSW